MDYNKIFADRYQNLNNQQREAVDTIDGPVLVVAGPGSGKTELLSMRVANILQKTDTLPSSILCLTFTDAAATNMRNRLAALIGQEAYKVAIHTFHSFGTEIINQNPEYFYKGAHYNAADELIQIQIMEEIFEDLPLDHPLNSYHPDHGYTYLGDVQSRIGELKKAGLTPKEFEKTISQNKNFLEKANEIISEALETRISKKTLPKINQVITELEALNKEHNIIDSLKIALADAEADNSTKPITQWKKDFTKKDKDNKTTLKDYLQIEKHLALADIYDKYQKKLHEKGYFDYDDMILDTINKLEENPELRYNIQEKYLYILVDEFQDTSGVQMRLLDNILNTELTENRPNILAVGDDDQSIFKFQGANIDNIMSFHKKYHDPKLIVLDKNYRSTQNILDLVRKVILKGNERLEKVMPDQITKELKAYKKESGKIIEKQFPTSFHEFIWIAEEIKKLNSPLNEIAIIAPKHRILEEIAKFLDYYDIPLAYERKQNLLEKPHIKEIIQILEFIDSLNEKGEPEADELLPEILSFPFWELSRVEIWKISAEAYKRKKLWLEIMLNHENSKIKEIAEFLINLGTESKEKTAEEIIDKIITQNYKDFYFNNQKFENERYEYVDFLNSLQSFIEKIREHTGNEALKVKDVVEFINLHKKHRIPLNHTSFFNNEEKAVSLLTAHKAKGQEFETVFVVNCQDDVWTKGKRISKLSFPSSLPLSPAADNIEDSLRLFYVALSRTKNQLYLTHHQYHENGKEQVKLRFLEETNEKAQGIHPQKVMQLFEEHATEKNAEKLLELKFNIQKHQPRNADENDLLQSLVTHYKLSVTHFNNFLNIPDGGPQKFLEQNLLRFPQPQSTAGAYGTAYHDALNQFQKAFKRNQTLESLDFLLEQFYYSLNKQRLNAKNLAKLLEKGQKQIPIYYENRKFSFDHTDLAEYNFDNQQVTIGNAQITGKIDKMHSDQDTNEIIVFDYKTGKTLKDWKGRSDYEKIKAWKYRNQLIFYKLLIENARDLQQKHKVHHGIIEFLEPDDEQTRLLNLEITYEATEQMRKLIQVVYNKIITLDFPDISKYDQSFYGIQCFTEDLLSK